VIPIFYYLLFKFQDFIRSQFKKSPVDEKSTLEA
jgi:hypothetical protein